MPVYNNFDIEYWNDIKRIEYIRSNDWHIDFMGALKKIKEQEKYDKVWELIKKKNGW